MSAQRVYFLRPVGQPGPIKIGCSEVPEERLTAYAAWSPVELELLGTIPGSMRLEAQIQASVAADHFRGEWFHATPAVLATVEAALAGRLDVAALPAPRRVWANRTRRPADLEAAVMTRRLRGMKDSGEPVPEEVYKATWTYRCAPEEKTHRRALVREYVLANWLPKRAA